MPAKPLYPREPVNLKAVEESEAEIRRWFADVIWRWFIDQEWRTT